MIFSLISAELNLENFFGDSIRVTESKSPKGHFGAEETATPKQSRKKYYTSIPF